MIHFIFISSNKKNKNMFGKKIKIKIIALFVLMFQILFLNYAFVSAYDTTMYGVEGGAVGVPEPISVGADILNQYNISSDSLSDMAQSFNVSANKINTPEVTLSFNPSDPKEGETLTASALPMYFGNSKENLYFTWYLVRKGCEDLDNNPSSTKEELCDADGNGEIEVNDWKVAAMKLIATQGYDNQEEPKPDYSRNGDDDGYKAYFGGGDKGADGDDNKHCYIYNADSGQTHELPECKHLFPSTNGHGSVGDNDFGYQEERFWGTNPQDANTAAIGLMDEANVAGLGQNTLSWIYQSGDRVGVAVEGTSIIATKYDDASYMTMWAFPKNKFIISQSSTKIYCQPASNATDHSPCADGYFDVSIPTACNTMSNDCGEDGEEETFKDNLIDPAEKTNEKLDVSLSYTPENPINDTSGDNLGDVLIVNSSISNPSQDSSQIYNEWKISAGKSVSGTFTDISQRLDNDGLISGKLSGINNPKIGVSLNLGSDYDNYFDNDIGYLKIKVRAKEVIPEKTRIGTGEVIIRINATGNRIKAYLTSSSDGDSLSKKSLICNETTTVEDSMSYYICPVVKNQILRLEVDKDGMSDFSWSVDGTNISCDSSLSADCSQGNIVFLPILGTQGDEFDVRMTAKNISNGKSIELSKKFQIVKPYIKIISNDAETFWPKLLGTYSDLDGKRYADYSDTLFETYVGAGASLMAEFHPAWLPETGILSLSWMLDGEENTDAETPAEINFLVTKNIGEIHNVTFNSFYVMPNELRKVLKNYWGVAQAESSGELISSSIRGEVVSEDAVETLSFKSPKKFLASIISNLPSQTLFLLKTVLVVFMIILMSGLAMSFSPDFSRNKK